ncbi:MAG: RNA 2'-phosphotransferase [Planctomycetota bacterium]
MNPQKLKRISKRLSYVLRHRPDSVQLTLGDAGWVDVDELLAALGRNGTTLTWEVLRRVVATNDKQRFEFSEDRTRIRARQGHSAAVDLGYQAAVPPETLFHGTATKNLESIRQQGLIKGQRHHVHLSTNKETMLDVARRHGRPVLLTVRAGQMQADGYDFFVTGNHVWLTDHVPPGYILFPA